MVKKAEAEIASLHTEIDRLQVEIAGSRESPRVAELIKECEAYKQHIIELEAELNSYRQNGGAPPQYSRPSSETFEGILGGSEKNSAGQVRASETRRSSAYMVSSPLSSASTCFDPSSLPSPKSSPKMSSSAHKHNKMSSLSSAVTLTPPSPDPTAFACKCCEDFYVAAMGLTSGLVGTTDRGHS